MSFETKDSRDIPSDQTMFKCEASPLQMEFFDHRVTRGAFQTAQNQIGQIYPKPDIYAPIDGLADAITRLIKKEVIKNMQDLTNPPPIVTTPK